MNWTLVVGSILAFGVLALLRTFGHAHLAHIPARLFGANRLALWLYALAVLPGTLLHESGHALAALALGVKVEKFSVLPFVEPDGVTLGHIRHGEAGIARAAVIGLAPLVLGTTALLLIGLLAFDMDAAQAQVAAGDWPQALATMVAGFGSWHGWLAAYLVFVISANMFPSRTDWRGWLPVGLFLSLLALVALPIGIAPIILKGLAGLLNIAFGWLLLVLIFTLIVDLFGVLLLTLVHQAIGKQFPQP